MRKLKYVAFLWTIVLITLLVVLTFVGKKYLKTLEPYERLENKLASVTENYVKNELDLDKGKIIVKLNELQDTNYIDKLETKNDSCTGYVVVKYKNDKEYKAYIKCKEYQTKGYE